MKRSFVALIVVLFAAVPVISQQKIRDLKPTVVLISLDGFRSDYIENYNPPHLKALAKRGVRARWMTPSYPTKTFPNHYTVATGLYPQNHGIVANNMYDPEFDAVFGLGIRDEVTNPRWWGGEPIWVTATLQGQKAGAFFFPGTETAIKGVLPAHWKAYDGKVPNEERVDTLLSWFDVPVDSRPTIYTLYFSDVDDAGHGFSPKSDFTKNAVLKVDEMIGRLMSGLKKRGIDKKANVIVVSDHGMAAVPQENVIVLDEYFDASKAERIFWVGELLQIWPKDGAEDEIYDSIKVKLPSSAKIYRKAEIPARFNYRDHRRIPPLLVVPDPGWRIVNKERYERWQNGPKPEGPSGSHGYDNLAPDMRALFIASGQAFKKGYTAEPFLNVEIYNVMCRILGLKPAPNDGNLKNVSGMLRN